MHSTSFSVSKDTNGLTILIAKHAALILGKIIAIWLFHEIVFNFYSTELNIGDIIYYFIIISIQINKRTVLSWKLN